MELSLSGNALKTLSRSITCLSRIASDLVLQASSSQVVLHTLNSSRSAYQSISFSSEFFDTLSLSTPIQCSVFLKSVCAVLRTPVNAVDRLTIILPSPDAPKLQWALHCLNGTKKTYWISCNVEPDIQQLSLDRRRFPSSLVVRPRDLTRLLSNFQSSLQEITIIATDPSVVPAGDAGDIGGKAIEFRSYIDPMKDNSDMTLHTQLWIDPAEEFVQYTHTGDPVDVTFGMKELKAFLSFCEGCEVDIHLFFEKAGEPILMAPRFGFDDGSNSDFDATLVLASMLLSQLNAGNNNDHTLGAPTLHDEGIHGPASESQRIRTAVPTPVSNPSSDHTKIWSDLSGSAARSSDGIAERHVPNAGNPSSHMENSQQRPNLSNISRVLPARANLPNVGEPMETDHNVEPQDVAERSGIPHSQHHPSNWVNNDDDDGDDEGDEELYVQSTPLYD